MAQPGSNPVFVLNLSWRLKYRLNHQGGSQWLKIRQLFQANWLPSFLWKKFKPEKKLNYNIFMCCHWIKKPKFNNVCVLFKHSDFCLRMMEMHFKGPRCHYFSGGHVPGPPRNLGLRCPQVATLSQVFFLLLPLERYTVKCCSTFWGVGLVPVGIQPIFTQFVAISSSVMSQF